MINDTLYTSLEFKIQEKECLLISEKSSEDAVATTKLPEILFLTTFPPRECGIATYSLDLINALEQQFENSFSCAICALESDSEKHNYKQQPKYILNTDNRYAFAKLAQEINTDENIKLIVMQHEFGFFTKKEKQFDYLCQSISKPIVFVFHTVLPKPNKELKLKVQDMAAIASSIIVMTESASDILINDYEVSAYKITVISHGTHLVPPLDRKKLKKQYRISDKKVLSTFGLLGPSKSIETTLDALPQVIKKHPDVLFLVLGKTHPSLAKESGEQYRKMLEEKVKKLKLKNHVRFVNEYLPLPNLLEYLQLTDIYLFTSKDPHQAVSGTFSYAVSAGCPVISTPIPHAKEVLGQNSGIIIDFQNSEQLSKAVISLLDDEALRKEISSNSLYKMASTAWQNAAIAHALLFERLTNGAFTLNYKIPPVDLKHVKKMTTRFGMIQFAKISNPDLHSGYALDDNARALIALCKHYELFRKKKNLLLITLYLKFIKYCQHQDGQFLNYVDKDKQFTRQNYEENLEDSTGRAVWALGYVISLKKILPDYITQEAKKILKKAIPTLTKINSTRAMAFIIKGLHYQNKKKNLFLVQIFADRLVQMYWHEKKGDWHWFESYLTYGNSTLPEALLCAYQSTGNDTYKSFAKESFDFLLSKIFREGKIQVVSNKGWHYRDSTVSKPIGGEQPIDVAYTLMALQKFYSVFKDEDYKNKAAIAFNWFLGDNHLHQIVYNPCTGGCYDGVEEYNVNLNQGAESMLSYLMARLTMEKFSTEDNHEKKYTRRILSARENNTKEIITSTAELILQ